MRFMMIVKADPSYEAGGPPNPALFAAIGKLSEEMTNAGVLLQSGGLLPSSKGARVRASGGKLTVTDGPFVETKEKAGGLFIIEARDLNEAIRIASMHPGARLGEERGWAVEVRPIADGCHQ